MADLSQTGSGNQPHIATSDYGNLHDNTPPFKNIPPIVCYLNEHRQSKKNVTPHPENTLFPEPGSLAPVPEQTGFFPVSPIFAPRLGLGGGYDPSCYPILWLRHTLENSAPNQDFTASALGKNHRSHLDRTLFQQLFTGQCLPEMSSKFSMLKNWILILKKVSSSPPFLWIALSDCSVCWPFWETSCLIYYRQILSINSEMTQLLILNASIFALSLVGLLALFTAPPSVQRLTLKTVKSTPLLGNKISSLVRQIWFMGENKKALLQTFVLSIGLQLLNIVAFYSITAPFFYKEIPLYYAITFIPLGMISIAVPISPAGLGVGHIIFDKLFAYSGISGGASLFNLYFLTTVALKLIGADPLHPQ